MGRRLGLSIRLSCLWGWRGFGRVGEVEAEAEPNLNQNSNPLKTDTSPGAVCASVVAEARRMPARRQRYVAQKTERVPGWCALRSY